MENTSFVRQVNLSLDVKQASFPVRSCYSKNATLEFLYSCIVPKPEEWILIVAYVVIFVLGFIGNVLVCFAVWRNKEMRTVTNIFMVNLSVADLAVILVLLPSALLVDITGTWFLGAAMCKISIALGVRIRMAFYVRINLVLYT